MNRDLVEIRGWAEELAEDPALDGHPRMGDVLGTAAFAAYHHGDQDRADRRARAGLDRDPGSAYCLHAAAVLALSRGAYAEVIDLARRADAETNRRHLLGIVALAKANTGDVDGARTLIAQGLPDRSRPRSARGSPTSPGRSSTRRDATSWPSGTTSRR